MKVDAINEYRSPNVEIKDKIEPGKTFKQSITKLINYKTLINELISESRGKKSKIAELSKTKCFLLCTKFVE